MKLFLDSANLKEVEDCLQKGVIQGITTNPSILSKEPKADFLEHVMKIAEICKRHDQIIPISLEVLKENPVEMVEEAVHYVKTIGYPNLNIKIPLIGWEELETIKTLSRRGIRINCTCLFNESQCLLAAYAGAKYVSLFRGRMKDVGIDANQVIYNARQLLDDANLDSEIIIGSIRGPSEIMESFLSGAHIVTSGMTHIKNMAVHPKSKESADQFLKDFKTWLK